MSVGIEGDVEVEAIIDEGWDPEIELEEEVDAWEEADAEEGLEASSKDWVTGRLAASVTWGLGFPEIREVDIARAIRQSISRER